MNALSLFSGIGGIDLACEWAGIKTVAFCEREPFCQAVIRKHWPGVPIYDDVRTLTKARLEADGIDTRTIKLIHGGYPCQPFSAAGKRKGKEDDRHLWPEVKRILEEIRPRWFVGENVAGHITLGLDDVLSDLDSIQYTAQAFVIPAAAVNAPHRRDRVFIVAYADSGQQWTGIGFQQSERSTTGERFGHGGVVGELGAPANTTSEGLPIGRQPGLTESNKKTGARMEPKSERCSENVADTISIGCDTRGTESEGQQGQLCSIGSGSPCGNTSEFSSGWDQWAIEPGVGRVANGIPKRVDRLKALGNAVVPQQIYPILAAIKQIDETFSRKSG